MQTLLALFIGFFALAHVVMFGVEFWLTQPSERDPAWENAVDAFIAMVLLAGQLLLYFEVGHPTLKLIWSFLTPFVSVVAILLSVRARRAHKSANPSSDTTIFADFGTLLLYGCAIWLNCMFAFGT